MPSVLECLRNENFSGGVRQITEQQAKLVGMPWPLFSGWKELCKNIHITEQQAVEFKKYDREGRKAMRGLPIIPFNQRSLQIKVDVNSKDFYTSREWRQIRYEAIKLHHGVCMCCGRSPSEHGVVLHVDHIQPKSLRPDLALRLDNLQVLCEDCNLGKSNHDSIEWEGIEEDSEGKLLLRIKKLRESLKAANNKLNSIRMRKKSKKSLRKTTQNS